MAADPIVQQVRSVRKEIERQYPDTDSFYEHLRQQKVGWAGLLPMRLGCSPLTAWASKLPILPAGNVELHTYCRWQSQANCASGKRQTGHFFTDDLYA